jgi:hypothetical protein
MSLTIVSALLAVVVATGPLPDHASADYAGKVGSSAVRMSLWRHGDQVEGYYVYESRYVTIDLAGTIDSQSHVRLLEKDRPKGAREVFSGELEENRFAGTWSPRGQGKKRSFHLLTHDGPWSAPTSWRRFERAGCPVSFLVPPRWRPRDQEGSIVLDAFTEGFDDGISVTWGKSPAAPEPYERRGERWFLNGENGAAPATDSVRVSGLRVSRDDRPCRIESAHGYQGLGDCACALVYAGDSWLVFDTQGPRYGPVLDVILTTLQPAAGR